MHVGLLNATALRRLCCIMYYVLCHYVLCTYSTTFIGSGCFGFHKSASLLCKFASDSGLVRIVVVG